MLPRLISLRRTAAKARRAVSRESRDSHQVAFEPKCPFCQRFKGRSIGVAAMIPSRDQEFFIGSGRHGYFLIDNIADAEEMRDFYQARIDAEQQNLDNLRRQSHNVGWSI